MISETNSSPIRARAQATTGGEGVTDAQAPLGGDVGEKNAHGQVEMG